MTRDEFERHFREVFSSLVGGKVLIALSGGADSVALLHLMGGKALGLEIEAAHVHHGVRGREADADAAFCERLCAGMDVPFHLLHLPTALESAEGPEAAWRQARYRALAELASARGLAAVATGHHRDDVAEGVLLQLLRGGGPRALAGITADTGCGVIRPLLPWSRAAIAAWLEAQELAWREDSSNRDLRHLRNRVRHRLLPELERAGPGVRRHLVHLARVLARDERWFADELAARSLWIDPWEPDGGVPVGALRELSAPLAARWLHAQASRIGITRVSRRQAELFEALLARGEPRAVTLSRRWSLRLAGGRLWLEPPRVPCDYDIELAEGRWLELPLPGWRIRLAAGDDPSPAARWHYRPPADVRLHVRTAAPDDRLAGGGTPARPQPLLARTLPRHLRRAWPVCCDGDRILWIPGVWRSPDESGRGGHVVEVNRRV